MRRLLPILGASFGVGVFSAFNNFTLSLWLATFTSSYLLIGVLANSRSFVGAIVSPLTGAWSDRVWLGRLGRRRPFILVGGTLAAVALALTPELARLPYGTGWVAPQWLPPDVARDLPRLGSAIITILAFTILFNAMDDVHQALLVDVTEPAERNRLSSLSVVVNFVGQVAILVLGFLLWQDEVPPSAFAVTAGLVGVGMLITVIGVREPSPAAWRARHAAEAIPASPLIFEGPAVAPAPGRAARLAQYRGAAAFCLVFFCYWSGVNAVMPLVSIYTRDILGASVGEAQLLPALLLLSTAALAIPMGLLGDRFGRRRVIGAGYAIVGSCGLAGLVITTKEQGAVVFLLAGVGNAAGMVLAIPLLSDLVPPHRVGAAAGILAASGSLAAPLASVVAGALSDLYGPRVIFALMAVMVALALTILPLARPPRSPAISPPDPDAAPRLPPSVAQPTG